MMSKKILAQGAEARIFLDKDMIIKERFAKAYRHPLLDSKLRQQRTRREAKVIEKLGSIDVRRPELISMDYEEGIIEMKYIPGDKLRDMLFKDPEGFSRRIGLKIAEMHNKDIIHGDLTTSNMLVDHDGEINFIDFGLSFFSAKLEDKAVDLHLLKQALDSKHFDVADSCFREVIDGYSKNSKEAKEILTRLDQVEGRGRNKNK